MNIVFMGTPEFAVSSLKALSQKGYKIDLVITQKDRPRGRGKKLQYTPVKQMAMELGLEVYQPDNINSIESIEKIKEINPKLIVVAAYGQILKKEILEIPSLGCINVHASLLPKYRGAAPINWAIINGDKETGITIMEMEEGLDTGDMLLSRAIPIGEEDDCAIIHDRLATLGGELIVEAIEKLKSNQIDKIPQEHKNSTYAPKIHRDTGKIDWNKSGKDIKNLVRGLKPWPSAYTEYKGEIVKIHRVDIANKEVEGKIGEIIKVDDSGIFVNCKDKYIVIKELQFPGKTKLNVSEYLKGNQIEEGIILI